MTPLAATLAALKVPCPWCNHRDMLIGSRSCGMDMCEVQALQRIESALQSRVAALDRRNAELCDWIWDEMDRFNDVILTDTEINAARQRAGEKGKI